MAVSSKWACLPLLLVASFISLASGARMFPLDTDDHSSISTSSSSDDLDSWPVTGVKRKLYVSPLQHDTDDDRSSVSTRMDNTAVSYSLPGPKYEKGQGLMYDGDVGTKTVVDGEVDDKDSLFRHLSDKEIDELMDDLEDVGMDDSNTDGGFDDHDKCGSLECGWSQDNARSTYGWGWNHGGGSSHGGIGGGEGGDSPDRGGGNTRGIGWSGDGGSTGGDDGSTGGIGWSWSGGSGSGDGHIGRDGVNIGGSGGSGVHSWHWRWHWGGGGSKVADSNDLNPNGGASGMSSDAADAPAPMSN